MSDPFYNPQNALPVPGLGVNQSTYTPTLSSSGAGVLSLVGDALATRDAGYVTVYVAFNFTPAVAGTPETISITLPTEKGFAPLAAFANTSRLVGACAGGQAADFVATEMQAENAGIRAQVILDQATAGAEKYGASFRYRVAG